MQVVPTRQKCCQAEQIGLPTGTSGVCAVVPSFWPTTARGCVRCEGYALRHPATPWPPSSLAHLSRSPVCARDVTHSRVHACVWCTTMSRFVAGGAAVCFFGRVMVGRTDCRRGRARQVHQGPRPRGCRLDPRRLGYANKGYLCCPFFSLAARDLWVKREP